MIVSEYYCEFLDKEYLDGFIREGGAAVRFCISDEQAKDEMIINLSRRAQVLGYQVANVDSAISKIQMIEQVFFAVAKQIDWSSLAKNFSRVTAAKAGYDVTDGLRDWSVSSLAQHYEIDEKELSRDINKQLQRLIFRDYSMVQEFRVAMLRLCQFELKTGQVSEAECDAINGWLTGSLRQVSLLKTARIFRKIGRHNARQMLFSLSRWLVKCGYAGLLLEIDISQFFKAKSRDLSPDNEVFYTRSAIMDAYESLRQVVDSTDEFSHTLTLIFAPTGFIDDGSRGLDAYQALKLRIADEVHDLLRDNPYAALIRLGSSEIDVGDAFDEEKLIEVES